jgi:transposase
MLRYNVFFGIIAAMTSMAVAELPDDSTLLKHMLLEQRVRADHYEQESKQTQQQLQTKERRIAHLEELIRYLKLKQYGKSSERYIAPEQEVLFNEAEQFAQDDAPQQASTHSVDAPKKGHESTAGKKRGRRALPDNLPRHTIYHDLAPEQKHCACGCALKAIDDVTSEQLAIIPAEMVVIRHCRKKYICPQCPDKPPVTAALPAQPLPKTNASPTLLAHIAVSKFLDGLPFYRQEKIWQRADVALSRATQANWMIGCGQLVQPVINLLVERQLQSSVMHLDETPVQVLKEADKPPDGKKYFWVAVGGPPQTPIYRFHYHPSRGSEVALELLDGFHGTLMTDDWSAYGKACETLHVTHIACNDHARRKFNDALNDLPKDKRGQGGTRPEMALNYYKKLYAVEKRIKTLSPEEKRAIRQQDSVPVWDAFIHWIERQLNHVTPTSKLGIALHYTYKLRDKLRYYCEDGLLPISNEKAENAIRPFAIARKNFLFYDSPKGAHASANLYSLIMTAQSHGLNPLNYLAYVFKELPMAKTLEEVEALLPWAITDEQINTRLVSVQ